MKETIKQPAKSTTALGKQRSYNEIIEFLDKHWTTNTQDKALSCIKKLDQALGNIAKKLPTILVTGTNGKSLTINFTAKLLKEEGLRVGTFYAPHILTYNERIAFQDELISNKTFAEIGNEVINAAEGAGLEPNSFEVLTMMALLHFKAQNVDLALFEASDDSMAPALCVPKIIAITRVLPDELHVPAEKVKKALEHVLEFVKENTSVVSADQSKLNLQAMQDFVTEKGGVWEMPIRKLAVLGYPFEQLHGRCAALAERISSIYINSFHNQNATIVADTLLTKQKGQRGRPTLEAKRQSELNPKKTVEQFWKETQTTLPGHFQLLDKEKPTLLLDCARNLDGFKNLLLGIRLLHYQRPLKGLTVVIGCDNENMNMEDFMKALRYFFKKTSGSVILCPITTQPGQGLGHASWDVEKVANDIKNMKINVRTSKNFKEAFEAAQKSVDERHGLVVLAGSPALLTEYWQYKGIKKL